MSSLQYQYFLICQLKLTIKIVEKDLLIEQEDIKRARREIKLYPKIYHPNILQLYEIIEKEHQLFFVMEYANNGNLFNYINQKGRIREQEACKFFHGIINGLDYLYSIGICHRNLRPENILLDENHSIKITDFINSNTYKPGTLLTTGQNNQYNFYSKAWGQPPYISPELIQGKQYNPLLLDVWSCGIILYFMVCGCLPFEEQNTTELYRKIIHENYSFPKKILLSAAIQDLISQMLQVQPEKRINLKQIKMHQWYQLVHMDENFSVSYNNTEQQDLIVQQLEDLGYSFEQIKKSLTINAHNAITTTLLLLMKKNKRQCQKNLAVCNEKTKDQKVINNLNDSVDNYYQQKQQQQENSQIYKEDRSSSCEIYSIYQENVNKEEKKEIMKRLEQPIKYQIKSQQPEILKIEAEYYVENNKNSDTDQNNICQENIQNNQNNDQEENKQENSLLNEQLDTQYINDDNEFEEDINLIIPQAEEKQQIEIMNIPQENIPKNNNNSNVYEEYLEQNQNQQPNKKACEQNKIKKNFKQNFIDQPNKISFKQNIQAEQNEKQIGQNLDEKSFEDEKSNQNQQKIENLNVKPYEQNILDQQPSQVFQQNNSEVPKLIEQNNNKNNFKYQQPQQLLQQNTSQFPQLIEQKNNENTFKSVIEEYPNQNFENIKNIVNIEQKEQNQIIEQNQFFQENLQKMPSNQSYQDKNSFEEFIQDKPNKISFNENKITSPYEKDISEYIPQQEQQTCEQNFHNISEEKPKEQPKLQSSEHIEEIKSQQINSKTPKENLDIQNFEKSMNLKIHEQNFEQSPQEANKKSLQNEEILNFKQNLQDYSNKMKNSQEKQEIANIEQNIKYQPILQTSDVLLKDANQQFLQNKEIKNLEQNIQKLQIYTSEQKLNKETQNQNIQEQDNRKIIEQQIPNEIIDQNNKQNQIIAQSKSRSKSQKKKSSQIPFNQEKFQMMRKQIFSQQKKSNVFDVRKQYQHTNIYDQNLGEKDYSSGRSCHEVCKHSGKKPAEVEDLEEIEKFNQKKQKKKQIQQKKEVNQKDTNQYKIQRPCQKHQKTQEQKEIEEMEQIQKEYHEYQEKLKNSRKKMKISSKYASPYSAIEEQVVELPQEQKNKNKEPFNIEKEKKKLDNMILSLSETSPSKNYKYTKQNINEEEQNYTYPDNKNSQKNQTTFNQNQKKKLGYSEIKAEKNKQKANKKVNEQALINAKNNEELSPIQDLQQHINQQENLQFNEIMNTALNANLQIHDGPFNLKYISSKNPTFIVKQFTLALNSLKYLFSKEKKFIFKIEKEKLKFTMEIKYLLNYPNLCYLSFSKDEGQNENSNQYHTYVQKIMELIEV